MAKFIYIVEKDRFFNNNGIDIRGGYALTDIKAFSTHNKAIDYIAREISKIENETDIKFEKYDYDDMSKNVIIFTQEQYNKYGVRYSFKVSKNVIE